MSHAAEAAKDQVTPNATGNGNLSVKDTITHVAVPAVVGALGVAGGVVLGRTALQRQKKVLGVPLPRGKVQAPKVKIDMADVGDQIGKLGKNIGEAGSNFAKLAREIQTTREKAEKLGKAIT